jgi:tyrosyl-tRNA synthetase
MESVMRSWTVPSSLDISMIGLDIAEVMVSTGLANTKTEARRAIAAGSAKIDGITIKDRFARLTISRPFLDEDGTEGEFVLLEKV